jgi:ATP-dependent Clp protease, protease subunit
MPAIKTHHTAVDTDSSWDGPAEEAKMSNDEKELRYCYAWEAGGDADPTAKASYKFPHHKAGTDTAANIAGVNNALARLDQADIPEGDKAGVRAHLNAHRKDAGLEVNDRLGNRGPIRCFEGSAQPHEPFWRWTAGEAEHVPGVPGTAGQEDPYEQMEPAEPVLELHGPISEYSWWGDEVTPKLFKDDLYKYGMRGPVTVSINSPGGEVIAANVIKTILQDYPGQVTGKIIGQCVSAATLVAMGCDQVKMDEGAFFMIHDPGTGFFLEYLNLGQLQGLVDQLNVCKDAIMNAYASKTGLGRTRLANMMAAETWMDATQAKALGFVDEILSVGKKSVKNSPPPKQVIQNFHYRNVPAALANAAPVNQPAALPGELSEAAERLRAQIKLIRS